jgi:transcriptional regulator with XRE-family HTH domain
MVMDMHHYVWETPEEINLAIAENVRKLRKRKGVTQKKLSDISGVSYGSIKRFEATGNISFLSLTKIAVALDAVDGVKKLFTEVAYQSIEEVINEQK